MWPILVGQKLAERVGKLDARRRQPVEAVGRIDLRQFRDEPVVDREDFAGRIEKSARQARLGPINGPRCLVVHSRNPVEGFASRSNSPAAMPASVAPMT